MVALNSLHVYTLSDILGMQIGIDRKNDKLVGKVDRVVKMGNLEVPFSATLVEHRQTSNELMATVRCTGNLALFIHVGNGTPATLLMLNLAKVTVFGDWLTKHRPKTLADATLLLERAVVKTFKLTGKNAWTPA